MEYLEISSFFTIFVTGALVILLGAAYVSVYSFVKIHYLPSWAMPAAYIFWILQTYSLYVLSVHLKINPFTQKVLLAAMVGYLIIPHIVYFLVKRTHEAVEH
ncbi:MAG TPA: hypothetical protein EYH06_13170 [Chromatiales bacterium]|nr:hypothetical protein [Thiotrichales bacterium]HIP69514.1 hypothetical protein [Chromatiales bacterium]